MIRLHFDYSIAFTDRYGEFTELPKVSKEEYEIIVAQIKRDPDKYNEHYYSILVVGNSTGIGVDVEDTVFNNLLDHVSIHERAFEPC